MTIDYASLTYRELQAEAKKHSIAANKKKDELVRLLTALQMTEAPAATTDLEADEIIAILDSIVDEAPEVVQVEAVEEEGEELTEVDELAEELNDMKLRGIATPQGKKTVFEFSSPDFKYMVNWGLEATLGSPAGKKPLNENRNPQSVVKTDKKKSNKVQWDSEEERDIESQQTCPSSVLKMHTPNAKLLQSADKSERKEIMMNFWLSKGTITPKKL